MKEVIARGKHGDQDALIQIYNETNRMVYFTALKIIGNESEAQDIVQETYIKVFQSLETLQDVEAFPKWIKTITVNLCKNQLKKKKPVLFETEEIQEKVIEDIPEVGEDFLPEEYALKKEKSRLIMEIIDQLPQLQKTAIILYYYDELSINEIANMMETNEGTIKSRLNYARKMIKDEVEKLDKKGTKLYAVPALPLLTRILLNASEDVQLPMDASTAILNNALKEGTKHFGPKTLSGTDNAGSKLFSAMTSAQKVISVGIVITLLAGIPTTLHLIKTSQNTEADKSSTTLSTKAAVQGVDAEIAGAYMILTVRPPEDLTHVTGYRVDLMDTANPQNNIHRQCDLTGKAYISFEAEGNYDKISVTTLLDTVSPIGVWESDIDIKCTGFTMPTYKAQYSVVDNLITAKLENAEAEFLQFDICMKDGDGYRTLQDDGYGFIDKSTNSAILGSNTWEEDIQNQLKSGQLFLRLRGWTYLTPTSDAEGIQQMSVRYYDFGPYVPISD